MLNHACASSDLCGLQGEGQTAEMNACFAYRNGSKSTNMQLNYPTYGTETG